MLLNLGLQFLKAFVAFISIEDISNKVLCFVSYVTKQRTWPFLVHLSSYLYVQGIDC